MTEQTDSKPTSASTRRLLSQSLPLIAASLLTMLIPFTDIVIAGQLGSSALAAVALGNALVSPITYLLGGIFYALIPLIAHAAGGGRTREIGEYVQHGFLLAIVVAAVGVALIFCQPLLKTFFEGNSTVVEEALVYTRGLAWGYPAMFIALVLRGLYEGTGKPHVSVVIVSLQVILNAVLDYGLMYGKWGLPALGSEGCALATAGTSWAAAVILFIYTMFRNEYVLSVRPPFSFDIFRKILVLGIPIGFAVATEVSLFVISILMVSNYDTTSIAAHQIVISFISVTFSVAMGFANGTAFLVANSLGADAPVVARQYVFRGLAFSTVSMTFVALAALVFSEPIVQLYTSDPDTKILAVSLMVFAALLLIPDGIQAACAGALRGFQDSRGLLLNNIVSYWIVGLPVLFLLSDWIGLKGLWWGMTVCLTFASLLHGWRLVRIFRSTLYESPVSA